MKTKLAGSVQMCGVRRLEQWIYSIFSKHVSFVRDGMDSYPCVAPFRQDKISLSLICTICPKVSEPELGQSQQQEMGLA